MHMTSLELHLESPQSDTLALLWASLLTIYNQYQQSVMQI